MNQAEVLGARMVMLARRLWAQERELDRTQEQINALWDEIRVLSPSEVYVATGELPRVPADPEATMIRPLNPNRVDGGHTFNLAPLAAQITQTQSVVQPCPDDCRELLRHAHLADGSVHRV